MPPPANELTEIEAAIETWMSPRLLRWFTSYAPKQGSARKLPFRKRGNEYFYDKGELLAFDAFLREPWPSGNGQRPPIPVGILDEIKFEAHFSCGICQYGNNGEAAHIDAVADSHSNHPDNLLWTCPNHHTAYDHGHRVHATLGHAEVRSTKLRLREKQARLWYVEQRAASAVNALLYDIEGIRTALRKHTADAFTPGLEADLNRTLARFTEASLQKEPGVRGALARKLASEIQVAKGTAADKADLVAKTRDDFLRERNQVPCPVCKGNGAWGTYDVCPACGGDAFMSREDAQQIDVTEYKSIKCPLCTGSGLHQNQDCPVCGGDGSLEKRFADRVDVRDYQSTQCPLCKGKGRYGNRDECPVCGGDGNIESRTLQTIDLSDYKMIKCKLCRGLGHTDFADECPACGGGGELEQRIASEIDWSQWRA
jgi:RecJ-like exonuclease